MPHRSEKASPGRVWTQCTVRLGADNAPAAVAGADLDERYAQAHRCYHTAQHVLSVVRDSTWLAGELTVSAHDQDILTAAACAHDVVYDLRPGDDERASATWAIDALTGSGVSIEVARRTADLVLTTIEHDASPDDEVASALLDADLAILAAAPDDYARYVDAVRTEYAAVTDNAWRTGRAAVLRGLVDRPVLFRTEPARRRWESAARANVSGELSDLAVR